MRSDGGALYTQIEQQLPNFVQHNHGSFSKFIEKYYEFLELNLLTFNDLDLNEYKPIQESNDVSPLREQILLISNNDITISMYDTGGSGGATGISNTTTSTTTTATTSTSSSSY